MKFASLANLAVTGRLHQNQGPRETEELAAGGCDGRGVAAAVNRVDAAAGSGGGLNRVCVQGHRQKNSIGRIGNQHGDKQQHQQLCKLTGRVRRNFR